MVRDACCLGPVGTASWGHAQFQSQAWAEDEASNPSPAQVLLEMWGYHPISCPSYKLAESSLPRLLILNKEPTLWL